MTLSVQDISHIARLARLELTEQEIKQYRNELSGIVRYVDQLQKTKVKKDRTKVNKKSSPWWRLDEVKPWSEAEKKAALDQAPQTEKKQVKVKRILV